MAQFGNSMMMENSCLDVGYVCECSYESALPEKSDFSGRDLQFDGRNSRKYYSLSPTPVARVRTSRIETNMCDLSRFQ